MHDTFAMVPESWRLRPLRSCKHHSLILIQNQGSRTALKLLSTLRLSTTGEFIQGSALPWEANRMEPFKTSFALLSTGSPTVHPEYGPTVPTIDCSSIPLLEPLTLHLQGCSLRCWEASWHPGPEKLLGRVWITWRPCRLILLMIQTLYDTMRAILPLLWFWYMRSCRLSIINSSNLLPTERDCCGWQHEEGADGHRCQYLFETIAILE